MNRSQELKVPHSYIFVKASQGKFPNMSVSLIVPISTTLVSSRPQTHHSTLSQGSANDPQLILVVTKGLYNVFLHPLHSYPGPWYARISRFWYSYRFLRGTLSFDIKELHDKYGDVVRVAPNELSYANGDAWETIYGRIARPGSDTPSTFKLDPLLYGGIAASSDIIVCHSTISLPHVSSN